MLRAIAVANGDHGPHSGLPRPGNHLLAIGVELLAIKMRVRIDKHDYCLCGDSRPRLSMPSQARLVFGYRLPYRRATLSFTSNLAPTGTSSKKPARTGLPPSSDAATIIPFDSMPRSLRGARLATITTFRPIKVSGA